MKEYTYVDHQEEVQQERLLKGMGLEEGATAKDRNAKIGGHKP